MQYDINKWFGNPIFITKIDEYESINKEIKNLINDNVKPTNSQFSKTTDVKPDTPLQQITDNLHINKKFIMYRQTIKEI
jgi:hypothetical protein